MKTISDKITELGGELGPPASADDIAQLEARLGFSLPKGLLELLRCHNGSTKDTDDAMWRFWPCAEITTHSEYRGKADFIPDNNHLRLLDSSSSRVSLSGRNLILFADSLIDLPTYGLFHSPGHRWHGAVFDASNGYLSARNWDEWVATFIERGEDGLLFLETPKEPEQDVHGNTH
jgi:hypothetical protein